MKDKTTVGVLPLARPTFDAEFAREKLAAMLAALRGTGARIVGSDEMLFDLDAARAAIDELAGQQPDRIVILQATFTDAMAAVAAGDTFDGPISIWAVPEPRAGGRLRLNSFCGLNLAAHALGLRERPFSYLYTDPDDPEIGIALDQLLGGGRLARPDQTRPAVSDDDGKGRMAAEALAGSRIARIGRHPDGFDTCAYDVARLKGLAGVDVEELELSALFDLAGRVSTGEGTRLRHEAEAVLDGLDKVDQPQLRRSLALRSAIETIRSQGGFDALAIRCWPETFTEYGGAVCGPVSMMGEARVPCACEADVYGALTQLLLQKVADQPVFLADLVDLDVADDTGVVWHCGQAPVSMAAEGARPQATIHTNRKMPLLFEFPLKPGRVTIFRISQARGETFAVIGGGEMLDRPMAFTGTSGVLRFDSGARTVLDRVIGNALEHHMAIVYGDHRNALEAAAGRLGIPVLAL
ncbi:MAG: hypothetical protein K5872_21480 [Rhizobiaceae bacterium]|nr:hypothetical protein [Rhizobiaceae bacterium]MCV0408790.1 hypothetical protein [Rhizobiaceae bacterium]